MSNNQNTQADLLQALRNAKDATEKTALIAESSLAKLPPDVAAVARRLVILHWFDAEIVAALRPTASQTTPDTLFERLQSLSFIEAVPEGLTYHALTRTGLIQRLLAADPEPLITGAKLAAPVYAAREDRFHHLEAFYCYLLAGETEQAAELLEDLLVWTGEGDDWSTQLQLFELWDEAESYPFVTALERISWHHVVKGWGHYNLGELETSIADYNEAIRLNPNYDKAFNNRGIAYWAKGELDRAIADYTEAIDLNSEFDWPYYNRGLAYKSKGELDRAIADYTEAIRLNPEDAAAYNNRGNAYSDKGELERAIADYTEALRLDPEHANAFVGRGNAYSDKGELEAAIADYTEAIRLNPDYANAYNNRGNAYSDKGELETAIADYNEALRINPDYASAFYNKACAYALQGKVAEMLPPLRRALELDRYEYLALIATDSDFDGVRGEARFEALLAEFGGTPAD